MSDSPEDKSLQARTTSSTGLSSSAMKTGLKVAQKDSLSLDQANEARLKMPYLVPLGTESVRLAVKHPPMWEYRLYFQSLNDLVAKTASEANSKVEAQTLTGVQPVLDWMNGRLNDYSYLIDNINNVIGRELQIAFGPPGQEGDAAAIVAAAQKVSQVYQRFIEIRNQARSLTVDTLLSEAVAEFSKICDQSIHEFETYPNRSLNTLMDALADEDGKTEVVLRFEMCLKMDIDAYSLAVDRARQRYLRS